MQEQTKNHFFIEMFGQFCITGFEGKVDEESIRSDMLVKLVSYIFCHRKKDITVQELVDVLWAEEDSINPAGALKNLVYRIRTILKKTWPDYEFIITGRGSYKWNEEVPIVSDIEIFEDNYKKALNEDDNFNRTSFYLNAIEAYKGTFLPKIDSEHWIAPWTAYYHSLYTSSVKTAASLLEEQERYQEMEQICSLALQMDPLSEDLYCGVIRSLIKQGKMKLAESQYRKAVNTLYENLGVSPSDELKDLYNEFLKVTHREEYNISVIQNQLNDESLSGAFLCEFGLFKRTYYLEKCRAERFGISVFLVLISVDPLWDVKPESQIHHSIINESMERLEYILLHHLRSGDVISRYSASQYVALLPTCQYETAKKVIKRINDEFTKSFRRIKSKLLFSLEELNVHDSHPIQKEGKIR